MGCLARKNPPLPKPFDCSAAGANCAGRLGATHWNPCYFINSSAPVLLDGARSLAGMVRQPNLPVYRCSCNITGETEQ
jgi:hypothetical protein